MGRLLPKRIEWLVLLVPVLLAALHFWSELQPRIGLAATRGPALGRLLQQVEGRAVDLKFQLRGPRPPNEDVVVAEVDEKSVQKYGRWPWSRELMARAIDHLVGAGAKAVGADIAWTDPTDDPSQSYRELLARLDAAAPQPDAALAQVRADLAAKIAASPDESLEAALKRAGPLLVQGLVPYDRADLADISQQKVKEEDEFLRAHAITQLHPSPSTTLPVAKVEAWSQYSVLTPLPRFAAAGNRVGVFAIAPDVDGTVRRMPMLVKLDGPQVLVPGLALATAAVFLGADPQPTLDESHRLVGVRLVSPAGERLVPLVDDVSLLMIDYDGPGEAFHRLSLSDVADGTFDPARVKGRAVLLGVSVAGNSGDQRVTPFRELEAGVYTHAAALSNLLSGRYLTRPRNMGLVEVLLILLLGLALAVTVPAVKSFFGKALVMLGAAVLWLTVGQLLFAHGVVLATVVPLLNVVLTSFASIFLGYLSVDREKLKLRQTFSKYLGEEVMEEALKHPDKLNQGEKREMTVLFSDIRGFTTLSERMVPEKLAAFINQYLSPMTAIVFEQQGTLDKYIGDAVMAFWNAPLEQPDHALRACRTALQMTKRLEVLKAKWRAESYPEFDIGIGINTGQMIVGNMGSDVRVDYTVMGDAVNLGSRLEGTNKEYQTRIILGEGTWEKVKDQLSTRRLGAVRVKGKRKPVRIYELRGDGPPLGAEKEAIDAFEAALEAYQAQRWDEAQRLFEKVLGLWPDDPPSRRYLEELPQLRARPPGPGWDGVYTATSK